MQHVIVQNPTNSTEIVGLAAYLVRDGLLNSTLANTAIKTAQAQEISLTSYLVKCDILSSQTIFDYCAKKFGLPIFDLKTYDAALLCNPIIKPELIWRHRILPISRDINTLSIGITDPTDHAAITAVSFHTGLHIQPMLVAEQELDKLISTYCRTNNLYAHLETALSKMAPVKEQPPQPENTKQDKEPVIEFANRIIQEAIIKKISDIHLEPYADYSRIRFRRDGLLYEVATLPPLFATQVATRLKVMALLNIAERRLPQDGRIEYLDRSHTQHENKIDIRINTCPTIFGEKIVLRILDGERMNLSMDALGMTETQKNLFSTKLSQPQGLILVTGPTGSGKTVTLYTALHYLHRIEKNIITVEDPVEIELSGINQVNINPKIGLTFAEALHAFLRQDPDIIMIGEIRDSDTAEIALQAAQTGHLVLSTLHTNSAAETITRLKSMGVATYNLISSISLIMAQRLLRKLCNHCKQPDPFSLPQNIAAACTLYRHSGCEHCHAGFNGRIGIFELLPMTETMVQIILSGGNTQHIAAQAKKEGHALLWDSGLEKVLAGTTSQAELTRIVGR